MDWIKYAAALAAALFASAGVLLLVQVARSIIRTPDEWIGPHSEFERLWRRERRLGGLSLSLMVFASACFVVWLVY